MTGSLFDGGRGRRDPFRCIQIDCPWEERGGGQIKRGADRHYPLVPTEQLPALITGADVWCPAEHAHLHFWVTDNFLEDGLWVVKQLGFRYVRTVPWVKTRAPASSGLVDDPEDDELRFGIGQYARGAHELMLFCVRGEGQHPSVFTGRRDLPSVIMAPVPRDESGKRIHSRKPPRAYEWIEARSHGPRLEMFARTGRPDWTSWGNEAPA